MRHYRDYKRKKKILRYNNEQKFEETDHEKSKVKKYVQQKYREIFM